MWDMPPDTERDNSLGTGVFFSIFDSTQNLIFVNCFSWSYKFFHWVTKLCLSPKLAKLFQRKKKNIKKSHSCLSGKKNHNGTISLKPRHRHRPSLWQICFFLALNLPYRHHLWEILIFQIIIFQRREKPPQPANHPPKKTKSKKPHMSRQEPQFFLILFFVTDCYFSIYVAYVSW